MTREPEHRDFFISYTRADTDWAAWTAWVLEEAGFSVYMQAWDFRPGHNFVQEMHAGVSRTECTIALLSPGYLASRFTEAEWQAAFRRHLASAERRLIPLRVQPCDPEGLLGTLVFADLVAETGEDRARALVLDAVRTRVKPAAKPRFPGHAAVAAADLPGFPGKGPAFRNLPRRRNPIFTGRDELLATLRESLRRGGRTTLSAVAGLGGIGKTQIALEYAYRFGVDYDVVWWVRAETTTTRTADLRALARAAGLEPGPGGGHARAAEGAGPAGDEGEGDGDETSLLRLLRPWLEERRSLLVLDNAAERGDVAWVDKLASSGHVLITSRDPNWRALGEAVTVPRLDPDDAAAFLSARSGDPDAEAHGAAARDLGDELGGLPLALEQAAAYMEMNATTPQEYLALYREHRLRLLNEAAAGDDRRTIETTWGISLDAIRRDRPAAIELMGVLSLLAPDQIPLDLVRKHAWSVSPALAAAGSDTLEWNRVVEALRRHSFIVRLPDGSVAVHRLVQDVVHAGLDAGEADRLLNALWHVLDGELPADPEDPHDIPAFARLVPHVDAVRARRGARPLPPQAGWRLAARVGRYFLQVGDLAAARLYAGMAVEAAGDDPHASGDLAQALTLLGLVLHDQGNLGGARETLERALRIDEGMYGADNPRVATDLSNLARVRKAQGHLAQARAGLERALEIDEQAFGPGHGRVALRLSNLGSVLKDQHELGAARESLQRALGIYVGIYGPDHPRVAPALSNLGRVLQDQGNLADAFGKLQRALQIDERVYGPAHPRVAVRLSNLGNVVKDRGDLAGARQLLERALAIDSRVYGPAHPKVATHLSNLGRLRKAQGDLAGARDLLERALQIDTGVYGPRHAKSAIRLSNLGRVLRSLGDLAGARDCLEQALQIDEAAYGPSHAEVATDLHNLGNVLNDQGDRPAALAMLERARVLLSGMLDEDHLLTGVIHHRYGDVLLALGRSGDGIASLEEAARIMESRLGSGHYRLARVLESLGSAYRAADRLEAAENAHRRAMEIYCASVGESAFPTGWCRRLLAVTLLQRNRIQEAGTLLHAAHSACLAILGPDHPRTCLIESELAALPLDPA
jgi:tetratricopeptide (TPR) repeat protein